MAIAPTGDIFKTLEFDGESSKSYGVYITGEAVYNAPEKDVEMISIPGRNGSFALDKGRFENIEVTYPAGIFATNESDFSLAISDFRNFLCSKKGYCRLTDDYNPDEFRMAIYKSGLEVEPNQLKAGEFQITFDCKPQRYMMSGESPIPVDDGDIILNPTLFDAKPLLEVGEPSIVSINGYEIEIKDEPMGSVELQHSWIGDEKTRQNKKEGALETFYDRLPAPSGIINTGDIVTAEMTAVVRLQSINSSGIRSFGTPTNVYVTDKDGATIVGANAYARAVNNKIIECAITFLASYAYGDPAQSTEYNLHFTIEPMDGTGGWGYGSFECDLSAEFWQADLGGESPLTLIADITGVTTETGVIPATALQDYTVSHINLIVKNVRVDSTADAFGDPTYIDCELGAIYKVVDGERISLNKYVSIGSDLPILKPGENVFTVDTLNANVNIVPRWWKI